MQFKVKVDVGNAGMQYPGHVASALREVARRLDERPGASASWADLDSGHVLDENGNSVGSWAFDKTSSEPIPERYTLAELDGRPTLHSGQFSDLKIHAKNDTHEFRVWLSRTGIADGDEYDNGVTLEQFIGYRWVTIKEYEAL